MTYKTKETVHIKFNSTEEKIIEEYLPLQDFEKGFQGSLYFNKEEFQDLVNALFVDMNGNKEMAKIVNTLSDLIGADEYRFEKA